MRGIAWLGLICWLTTLSAGTAQQARGCGAVGGEIAVPIMLVVLMIGYRQMICDK